MVGFVLVNRSVRMMMRDRFGYFVVRRGLAGCTDAQPRVEIAAAKRHRHREKDGYHEPEWTAAIKHTFFTRVQRTQYAAGGDPGLARQAVDARRPK